jgi:hypothetical protein
MQVRRDHAAPVRSGAPALRLVNELVRLGQPRAGRRRRSRQDRMDACIWLLSRVWTRTIRWSCRATLGVDRANVQSGDDFFMNTGS